MDMSFECHYCDAKEQLPKPRMGLFLELTDETGTITAHVDHKYAESLIGITADEIYDEELSGQMLDITKINEKLHDVAAYYQVRTLSVSSRGPNIAYMLSAHVPPRHEECSTSIPIDDADDDQVTMKRNYEDESVADLKKKKIQ